MVKRFFLLFFPLLLFASQIEEIIHHMLPDSVYDKNKPVIATLFSNRSEYMNATGYDYQKIFSTLERVGILEETLGANRQFYLHFMGDGRPFLLMRLSEKSLDSGNIYRYEVSSITFSLPSFQCVYKITNNSGISFAKIVKFLNRNGIKIKNIEYSNNEWKFDLDMENAHIDLPKVVGNAQFKHVKDALWLDVCGKSIVKIHSFGNFWHPSIAFYDIDLAPLDMYKKYEVVHDVELTLPKRACYIKISDIFTPKNIKRGFRISLE